MDGFFAAFHQKSLQTVGVATMQSRVFTGQAEDAFIFCVPGSTGACRYCWSLGSTVATSLAAVAGRAHIIAPAECQSLMA